MISLMIVDDEENFIDYLKEMINWQSYGIEICCVAMNGEEAFDKAKIYMPDIILLDINMPRINGMELMDHFVKEEISHNVIFVTGQDKFEYAKKAIEVGAFGYILKPFDPQELILNVLKLKGIIEESYEKTLVVEERMELNFTYLNQFISGHTDRTDDNLIQKLESLQLIERNTNVLVTVIEINSPKNQYIIDDEKVLWNFAVKNILREMFENCSSHIVFNDNQNNLVSLTVVNENDDYNAHIKSYNELREKISGILNFCITIGVGTLASSYYGMRDAYNQALTALNKGFVHGMDNIYFFEKEKSTNVAIEFYSNALNNELVTCLRATNLNGALEVIQKIYETIDIEEVSTENILCMHQMIVSLCLSYITQTNRSVADVLDLSINPISELNQLKTVSKQRYLIEGIIKQIITYYQENKTTRASIIVSNAKKYIHENYASSNLVIKDIAMSVYINATYLRNTFLHEEGITIGDYITDVRMEKAKELVLDKKIKITEIGYEIGYNYPGYFSKCFKKYYGMSPSEYTLQNEKI